MPAAKPPAPKNKSGASTFLTTADALGSLTGPDIVDAQIPNSLASSQLDTAILLDPIKIQAYKDSIASQMNKSKGVGWVVADLSERICDITIQTSAQGAGMLKLMIADPGWMLLTATTPDGSTFISVDEDGYLWPPIDVNFPADTDTWWRLCQVRYSNDLTGGANGTLTFEDRIASILRERSPLTGGIKTGTPDQSLASFIKQLVDDANQHAGAHIRLVELLAPSDPNAHSPSTFTPTGQTKTHKTNDKGLSPDQLRQIDSIAASQAKVLGKEDSLQNLERLLLAQETTAPPPTRLGAG